MLDLSPTNVGVTEPGLSPTGVGVIDLQDWGRADTNVGVTKPGLSPTGVGVIDLQDWGRADMGFWQLLLISAFGLSQTDVRVTDPQS